MASWTYNARQSRRRATRGEVALWGVLRGDSFGVHFRRQHALPPFIVDFVCLSAKLIVEVDGPHHDEQREADADRQSILESRGFSFVRVTADDAEHRHAYVIAQVRTALDQIETARANNSPSPQPKVLERGARQRG